MRYIKCLNIAQIPEPTLSDVPRLIWAATGEFFVDLEISKEPVRIKVSDILTRHALPDNPRESALYKHNGKYKYHDTTGWKTISTTDDLLDAEGHTLSDLFTTVFDKSTGLAKLNEELDDVVELLAGDTGLTALASRIDEVEDGLSNFLPADEIQSKLSKKADLDSTGKVKTEQLPSYVDDVIDCYTADGSLFSDADKTSEIVPEAGKIYIDLETNKTYRWSGTTLVEISQSLALGEVAGAAFPGDRGKLAEDAIVAETINRIAAVAAINASTVTLTGYIKEEGDSVALEATDSVNTAFDKVVSHLNTLDEISGGAVGDLSAIIGRVTAVEGEVDVLQSATAGYDADNTVSDAIATAKTAAATDATTKANAAQSAAEATAAAALALTEAKLSKEGETAFTAENTVRGAVDAVESELDNVRNTLDDYNARIAQNEQALAGVLTRLEAL